MLKVSLLMKISHGIQYVTVVCASKVNRNIWDVFLIFQNHLLALTIILVGDLHHRYTKRKIYIEIQNSFEKLKPNQ